MESDLVFVEENHGTDGNICRLHVQDRTIYTLEPKSRASTRSSYTAMEIVTGYCCYARKFLQKISAPLKIEASILLVHRQNKICVQVIYTVCRWLPGKKKSMVCHWTWKFLLQASLTLNAMVDQMTILMVDRREVKFWDLEDGRLEGESYRSCSHSWPSPARAALDVDDHLSSYSCHHRRAAPRPSLSPVAVRDGIGSFLRTRRSILLPLQTSPTVHDVLAVPTRQGQKRH